jgi:DNA-directed RNA polymerase specialized sigma24 family protein
MGRTTQEVEARDFLIASLFTGRNHREIGEIVGLSRSAVYNSLTRHKNRMELEKEYKRRYDEQNIIR